MTLKNSFPAALKTVRKARGLSQEAFSDVSSRTYMSSLERGLKSPTLSKVAELCEVMDVHPLTLLTLAYGGDSKGVSEVIERVQRELAAIQAQKGNRQVKGAALRQRPRDGYVTIRSAWRASCA
jgi:transcriptional regulator with XRE-family HTH domain